MAVTQTYIRRQIMGILQYSRALMRSAPSRLKQALSFKNYVRNRLLLGRKNRFIHHVHRYQKKAFFIISFYIGLYISLRCSNTQASLAIRAA